MADDSKTADAVAQVEAWCRRNRGWNWRGIDQPGQGSTNRVILVHRDGEVRVCKVFCEQERREREVFALRHWAATGLVPRLFEEVGERMIVMAFIPGAHLLYSRRLQSGLQWYSSCREVGRAMAGLVAEPLNDTTQRDFESRYYRELPTLEAYLSRILELGRRINAKDPGFLDPFWTRSLDYAERGSRGILSEVPALYHQDVGNLHVSNGQFMGFYDLEMCRVGCVSMQLGSALAYLEDDPGVWEPMCEGWEQVMPLTDEVIERAVAVHHLLCWRVICRYMSYDGTPGTGFPWAEPANAECYRRSIEGVHSVIGLPMP